jgi:hypothetical protein
MPLSPQITNIAETANKEILKSTEGAVVVGVIIAAGQAAIVPGTILGKITASSKYGVYSSGAVDGRQVAVAIAGNFTDPAIIATKDSQIHVYLRGNFKLDQLVGLDAAAATSLGGRQDAANNLFAC